MFVLSTVNCSLFTVPADAAQQAMGGRLIRVEGNVEVQKLGSEQWIPASAGMEVGAGDRIMTGFKGTAALEFDNSVTEIKPVTQMVVGRAIEGDDVFYTEVFLQVGRLITEVDPKSGKQNRFNVVSPTAVAGVRGTIQETRYAPATGMDVNVIRGHSEVSPVRPEQLPPAVQGLFNIAPQDRGSERGKRDEAPGRGKLNKQTPLDVATPQAAVEAFNEWISAAVTDAAAGGADAAVMDPASFEYSYPVGADEKVSVKDGFDPAAVVDAAKNLAKQSVTDVTPAGLSAAERDATTIYTEPVSATFTESQKAEQSTLIEVNTQTSIESTTTNLPPARPQ